MARINKQISVGRGLSPDELLSALRQEANELHEMLVGDVTRFNLRADYTSDSLQLEAVERYGKGVRYSLRYSFGWEAYWGCRDSAELIHCEGRLHTLKRPLLVHVIVQ